MKNFFKIFTLIAVLFTATINQNINAQSFQWHQSYRADDGLPNQKFIMDYFWSNDKFNVFSWNEFQIGKGQTTSATALLYVEYQLGNTGLYLHPEVRLFTASNNFYYAGLSYRLPFKNQDLGIYLVSMFAWHGYADYQFSINSSYETPHFYYEGFFDSNWVGREKIIGNPDMTERSVFSPSCYTEQKFYYKINETFHIGANLVFMAGPGYTVFRPMLVARVSLY